MASSDMFKVTPELLVGGSPVIQPDLTVFENKDFQGNSWRTSSGYSYVGDEWNDRISSIIVHSGSFLFYEDSNYGSTNWGPVSLEPGQYSWVGNVGIGNDSISSWKAFYGSLVIERIND